MIISEREQALLDENARRLLEMYSRGQSALLLHEVDELSKAGELSPGVLGVASAAFVAMERYDEALESARRALDRDPRSAWLHHVLAAAHASLGETARAAAAQAQSSRLMPAEPLYAAALARYLRRNGQTEESVRTARGALVLFPADAGCLNELGLSLLETGDLAAAHEQFRKSRASAPDAPESFIHEGMLHLRSGHRAKARQCFREALKRRPGLSEAEEFMADAIAGYSGFFRRALGHVLTLGRVTLVGWAMIAFVYYLIFRLLQFLWRLFPGLLPAGRTLLLVSLAYLVGGLLLGRFLRYTFRLGRRQHL